MIMYIIPKLNLTICSNIWKTDKLPYIWLNVSDRSIPVGIVREMSKALQAICLLQQMSSTAYIIEAPDHVTRRWYK